LRSSYHHRCLKNIECRYYTVTQREGSFQSERGSARQSMSRQARRQDRERAPLRDDSFPVFPEEEQVVVPASDCGLADQAPAKRSSHRLSNRTAERVSARSALLYSGHRNVATRTRRFD